MARRPPLPLSAAPATEAVRHIGIGFMKEADRALARLKKHDKHDEEALHDFRVALRRLRTLLKAYRNEIALPGRLRRRLGALADATNAARDAEVAAAWLTSNCAVPGAAIVDLRDVLIRERDRAHHVLQSVLPARWPPLAAKLRDALAQLCGSNTTFAHASALIATSQVLALETETAALLAHWSDEPAHCARLAAKRLRYVLEPFAPEVPQAADAVKVLKQVQESLGQYHDSHVLLTKVADAASETARKRILAPGAARTSSTLLELEALAAAIHARRTALAGEACAQLGTTLFRSLHSAIAHVDPSANVHAV